MQDSELVVIRLFYNISNRSYYLQIGFRYLFMVKATIITALSDGYKLDIIHAADYKEMQEICNSKKEGM